MSESSPGIGATASSSTAMPDQAHSNAPRRSRRTNRNPKSNGQRPERYEGKWGHIYDVSRGFNKQGETFQKTTREIAEYIGRDFDEGGEFRTGLVKLDLPQLTEPVPPDNPNENKVGFEMWKFEFARYKKESANRKRNKEKAYDFVLGQCSPAVHNIIEAHEQWNQVNNLSDVIGLLKLIQQAVITKNTSKHEIHAYVDALHNLYAFCQSSNMSHSEYLDKFKALVEIIKQLGGDIGGERQLVRKFIMMEWGTDPDYLDDNDYDTAVETCHERFLAVCLITKADRHRVGNLIIDISNEYTRNPSSPTYPKTVAKAYEMIINYRAKPQQYQDISNEGGLTFLNDGGGQRGGCTSGRGGRSGRGFGGRGRGTRDSASRRDDSDDAQFLLDRVNDLESDFEAYLDTRNTDMILQQSDRKLPSGWIILDSASTVCMFSEPGLLNDIHKVQRALTVRCNAGIITTNLMGYYANIP